ncbi:hypothetical protein NUM3379_14640 [Kineococcus sp. NUM-3379]
MRRPSAAALLGAALLCGCAGPQEPGPARGPGSSAGGPAAPGGGAGPLGTAPAPAPPPLDDNGPTEAAVPEQPGPEEARQAVERAVGFLRAFARRDLPQDRWWQGVSGFLTPAAAEVYSATAVENVPVSSVDAASARLAPATTAFVASVTAGTDDGVYTVTLVRAGGTWLVERCDPPR